MIAWHLFQAGAGGRKHINVLRISRRASCCLVARGAVSFGKLKFVTSLVSSHVASSREVISRTLLTSSAVQQRAQPLHARLFQALDGMRVDLPRRAVPL